MSPEFVEINLKKIKRLALALRAKHPSKRFLIEQGEANLIDYLRHDEYDRLLDDADIIQDLRKYFPIVRRATTKPKQQRVSRRAPSRR